MDERKRIDAEVTCLDIIKPRLFDCFSDMIAKTPAASINRVLARESYMLGVDLARQRPLLPTDVGSILIFSRFIGAGGKGLRLFFPTELPAQHVTFFGAHSRTVD